MCSFWTMANLLPTKYTGRTTASSAESNACGEDVRPGGVTGCGSNRVRLPTVGVFLAITKPFPWAASLKQEEKFIDFSGRFRSRPGTRCRGLHDDERAARPAPARSKVLDDQADQAACATGSTCCSTSTSVLNCLTCSLFAGSRPSACSRSFIQAGAGPRV